MAVKNGMGVSGIGLVIGLVFLLSGCSRKTVEELKGSERFPAARDVTGASAQELIHAAPRLSKKEKALSADEQAHSKYAPKLYSLAEQFRQCEAQLPDVAFPLGLKPVQVTTTPTGNYFLAFTTQLEICTLTSFYVQEMERMGWKQLSGFEGPEVLLIFSKPNKFCTVCVRQENPKRHRKNKAVSLFLTMRGT